MNTPRTLNLLALWLSCVSALAVDSGLVTLRLEVGQGLIPSSEALSNGVPQSVRRDMGLEFTLRDGQWEKEVAGYAVFYDARFAARQMHTYNKADHDGRLRECQVEGGRARLAVDLTVNKDMWGNGGSEFVVVMTVQKGVAPEVTMNRGKATIGGRRVSLDGEKLILHP